MGYSDDQLNDIFDRSGGDCHLCGKRLAFKNYGKHGARGAWEVDHSKVRSRGGTDRLNNLYPACIGCNRSKRDNSTRAARRSNGLSRSPLSTARRKQARKENTLRGAIGGAMAGGVVGGPIGAFAGAIFGGLIGNESRPR